MKKFEDLEHTADLGLRVYGQTLPELLSNAAEGMFSLIGHAEFNSSELRQLTFDVPRTAAGADREPPLQDPNQELLYKWLRRLLQEFNLKSFFPVTFQIELTSVVCTAKLTGATFDPAIHTFYTEIKGVTWHGLKVAKINSKWQAELIFDV